jgi:hypothetical protein
MTLTKHQWKQIVESLPRSGQASHPIKKLRVERFNVLHEPEKYR